MTTIHLLIASAFGARSGRMAADRRSAAANGPSDSAALRASVGAQRPTSLLFGTLVSLR